MPSFNTHLANADRVPSTDREGGGGPALAEMRSVPASRWTGKEEEKAGWAGGNSAVKSHAAFTEDPGSAPGSHHL